MCQKYKYMLYGCEHYADTACCSYLTGELETNNAVTVSHRQRINKSMSKTAVTTLVEDLLHLYNTAVARLPCMSFSLNNTFFKII